MNTDENFNFYHELTRQQNYNLLIPNEKIMRVVILLYQKEQAEEFFNTDGKFTEEVILECIRIANPTEQRIPHEMHNQIIQKLLHYFLWRGDDNFYALKDYARELCKLVEGRLRGQFDPTQIEKIFNELIQSLETVWKNISISPKNFNDWVDVKLKNYYQPMIQKQVEILDKKVDEAVRLVRLKVTSPEEDLLVLLQSVDTKLNIITNQIDELDSVFHSSEIIRQRLIELQNHPDQEVFNDRVNTVYVFLSKIEERLSWVRRRINKIRPRIQRLFSDLRKREFDLKTERFLNYLLKHSSVIRHEQKKVICLPNNISLKQIYSEKLVFKHIVEKTFSPPKPTKIICPTINKDYQQKQYQRFRKTRQKHQRLKYWFSEVEKQLEDNQIFIYSPIFYKILAEEVDGFSIALELAHYILNMYARKKNYQLIIGKRALQEDNFYQYSLYEIEVRKLHV